MKTIRLIFYFFDGEAKKKFYKLISLVCITAFIDAVGVASIMPFVAVLSEPKIVETNFYLKYIYNSLDVSDEQTFLFFLGVFVFCLLTTSLFFKGLVAYFQLKFALMCEYRIGKHLFSNYLAQSYVWFLGRNSAQQGSAILSEVDKVIYTAILPFIVLVTQASLASAIIILLLLVEPILIISLTAGVGFLYFLLIFVVRNILALGGEKRLLANAARFKAVNEAFGAIKEIKVLGIEDKYIARFDQAAHVFAAQQGNAQIIAQIPRYVLEAVGFGGMILIILFLMTQKGALSAALPTITMFAYASYRLIPCLHQVYASVVQLRFASAALDSLSKDICLPREILTYGDKTVNEPSNVIALREITFSYPGSDAPSLDCVSLNIKAGSQVGFVGASGSGKTTIVDVILGILTSEHGIIEVDGLRIGKHNFKSWSRILGYVPQSIYLVDDTLVANIALGIEPEAVNMSLVEEAARKANLYEFIVNELPDGFNTLIGEHGMRLSGGQRQRIAVARALYRRPKVLVLDEATSALDNIAESEVMKALNNLRGDVTVLLIAHRLSTVKHCDKIFFLEKGKVVCSGTFDELMSSERKFQEMAANG